MAPSNKVQIQKEGSLLRQSRKKWRGVKSWAAWRQAYADRTGGNEHDDVEPSAENKTSGWGGNQGE